MSEKKDAGLRIRVAASLRKNFLEACRQNDRTAAQVLRDFMRDYVERAYVGRQEPLFKTTNGSNK